MFFSLIVIHGALCMRIQDLPLDLEAEERRVSELRSFIITHVPPPATLGSKAGSLFHRLSCLVHVFSLLTSSGLRLERLLRSIVCICTDLGTESSLHRVRQLPLNDILPWYGQEPVQNQNFGSRAKSRARL